MRAGSQLATLILITATYLISWYHFYFQYFDYHLKKEPKIYETYCKKTAEYISKTIPPNTLILLPNEMCKELITVVLWDRYKYGTYSNESDLEHLVYNQRKETFHPSNILGVQTTKGVIVQIAGNPFPPNTTRPSLEKINNENLMNRIIIEDNNIPYAYLYMF